MAISAGMAIIGTATTGAMIGAGVAGAAFLGGSMMSHFLITTAMGAAMNALAPKPSMPSSMTGSNPANRGYQVSTRGAALDHQVIYGRTKVGGAIVFDAVSGQNNKILHRVIVFAGHPSTTLHNVYFNDERIDTTSATDEAGQSYLQPTAAVGQDGSSHTRYNSNVRIYERITRDGTLDDEKLTRLIQAGVGWTDQHLLEDCTFIYIRFEYDADVFPNGVPDVTADISGKKVYQVPLTTGDTWSQSHNDNPAWCIADFLLDANYGLGEAQANVDIESFRKAANVCEHKIYGRGSSSTAVNVSVQYFDGSDQANLIYEGPHSIQVGDTVQIDDSTYPTLLFNILGVDETSLEGDIYVTAISASDFTIPVTMDAAMSGNGVVEQAGSYTYYHTQGGDQRFKCDGAFTTAATPHDLLMDLLSSCAGILWYSGGKWRIKAGYYDAPATDGSVDFDEDDLRSAIQVSTRNSRRDNFNTVRGVFRGPVTQWQPTDYKQVQVDAATLDAEFNNQVSVYDLDLPFTTDFDMCRHLALITLERNLQQIIVNASFGMRAFKLQVGDIIRLSNTRFGWTNKPFEVIQWTFGLKDDKDLHVDMVLREIAASVFDEVLDGAVYLHDNTNLLSPFEVPTLSVIPADNGGEIKIINEKVLRELQVDIGTTDASRVDQVEVQFRSAGSGDYRPMGSGDLGRYTVPDLDIGNYDVRARGTNTFGIKGQWTYALDFKLDPPDDIPADVGTVSFDISQGTCFLRWPPVADRDLSYYQLKFSSVTQNATWENSETVIERVARPGTNAALPARSGTFLIKAVDKVGQYSENASSVVILPSQLPQLGNTDEQEEDPGFPGTKSNVVVDTSANPDELIIDDTSAASPTGTYYFGGSINGGANGTYIDTGSARTARATGIVTFNRHIDYSAQWDNIPQTWNTWPGTWDNWLDEDAAFDDHEVVVEARATNDDPSGSPTWGSWFAANGQEIVGRAFQFRAVLTASNTEVSPSIETLDGEVTY